MSHFYGRLYGSAEKSVTRTGSAKSGIEAKFFSTNGDATLRFRRKDDRDWLELELNGTIIFERPIESIGGPRNMTEEEIYYRREIEPRESRAFKEWWKAEAEKLPSLPFDELFRLRTIAFLAFERGFKEGVNL